MSTQDINTFLNSQLFAEITKSLETEDKSFIFNKNYSNSHDEGSAKDFHMEPVQLLLLTCRLFASQ